MPIQMPIQMIITEDTILKQYFNFWKDYKRMKIYESDSSLGDSGTDDLSEEHTDDSIAPHDIEHADQYDFPLEYKKLSFEAVEKNLNKHYYKDHERLSSSLDIVASYMKGQNHIYMESKHQCEQELNKLMMPAMLLSACATVLSQIVNQIN